MTTGHSPRWALHPSPQGPRQAQARVLGRPHSPPAGHPCQSAGSGTGACCCRRSVGESKHTPAGSSSCAATYGGIMLLSIRFAGCRDSLRHAACMCTAQRMHMFAAASPLEHTHLSMLCECRASKCPRMSWLNPTPSSCSLISLLVPAFSTAACCSKSHSVSC